MMDVVPGTVAFGLTMNCPIWVSLQSCFSTFPSSQMYSFCSRATYQLSPRCPEEYSYTNCVRARIPPHQRLVLPLVDDRADDWIVVALDRLAIECEQDERVDSTSPRLPAVHARASLPILIFLVLSLDQQKSKQRD